MALRPKRCKTYEPEFFLISSWSCTSIGTIMWPTAMRWTSEFCALSFLFSFLSIQLHFLTPPHWAVSNLSPTSPKLKWPSPHNCFSSSKKPLEKFHMSGNNLGTFMHECFNFYYFLLPGKIQEHLSIRLMFKLFPAYFLPNLRNAASSSTGDFQDSIRVANLDVAGAYQLYFSRLKKLTILDYCYLFELYITITNFKPLPVPPADYTKKLCCL